MKQCRTERELAKWIDSLTDEVNAMYMNGMPEEKKIDSRIADIRMRDEIISQIRDEIRFRKILERMEAIGSAGASYVVKARVSSSGMEYVAGREEA